MPLSLLGVSIVVAIYLFASYDFYVFEVSLRGNEVLSADDLLRASGIEGYSIFFIDPRKVKEAVETLPDVAQARVECRLPNRVNIEIEERQPYLIWQAEDKSYYLDREGVALSPRDGLSLSLTLKDLGGDSLRAGERINPQILEAFEIYRSLLPEVKLFHYSPAYGLGFITQKGQEIRLGYGEDAPAKVALLRAILKKFEEEGVEAELIDLRFQIPYYRAAEG